MTIETTSPEKALAEVRKEIDALDDALHDLLMKRTELVVEVAEAKARAASAAGEGSFVAFRPAREAQVLRRLAERHRGSLPVRVIFRLWREIIAAMTRIQGPFRVDVFGGQDGSALSFWDLARSYYGSSTPMELHDNARDVLRRVVQDRSVVGILPEPGTHAAADWWVMFAAGGQSEARVVACLPFIDVAEGENHVRALVVAQTGFEPTGDDTSLVAISSSESLSDSRVTSLVAAAGFSGQRIADAKLADGPSSHIYLISMPFHVAEDDKRLAALEGGPILEARLLGGYANPIERATDGE
ncbi:chorismate mutase [Parvibaculum lavamentivorans DS-1]|uniref:chorismate mutase n=1 Tax=Parvibaculum lavamentivorans (strain DS-1 / DSM 13023 / NCIMB 13966) TaxID=402881 RepID=A7HTG8_PARL1|nr:chorismate mutase [Parvibaculum lavamentivorans]ABS63201.1 chorismate mutase [Parvibaculum lavamentivorans DS-1]